MTESTDDIHDDPLDYQDDPDRSIIVVDDLTSALEACNALADYVRWVRGEISAFQNKNKELEKKLEEMTNQFHLAVAEIARKDYEIWNTTGKAGPAFMSKISIQESDKTEEAVLAGKTPLKDFGKEALAASDAGRGINRGIGGQVLQTQALLPDTEDFQYFMEARSAALSGSRSERMENILKYYPQYSAMYAAFCLEERWLEGEETIKKDPVVAAWYAETVMKERWPAAEEAIFKNEHAALYYTKAAIRRLWENAGTCVQAVPEMFREGLRMQLLNRLEESVSKA